MWRGLRTVRNAVPPASNQAPVIAEGTNVNLTMSEDGAPTPFILTLHATDADNDPICWGVGTPASHGGASVSGYGTSKDIAYAPAANYFGSDNFVMEAYDIWGAKTSLTVNVTIQPVNDAPVANAQSVSVAIDTPRAITLTGSDFTFKVNDGAADSSAPATVTLWVNSMAASGGTMTNCTANGTNYTAHIFTTVGSSALVVSAGGAVEVLVVAGGGGGGAYIANGGAGGSGIVIVRYGIAAP